VRNVKYNIKKCMDEEEIRKYKFAKKDHKKEKIVLSEKYFKGLEV